jgi:hypothetical protein
MTKNKTNKADIDFESNKIKKSSMLKNEKVKNDDDENKRGSIKLKTAAEVTKSQEISFQEEDEQKDKVEKKLFFEKPIKGDVDKNIASTTEKLFKKYADPSFSKELGMKDSNRGMVEKIMDDSSKKSLNNSELWRQFKEEEEDG